MPLTSKDVIGSNDATQDYDSGASEDREPGLVVITGSSLGEYYSLVDDEPLIVGRGSECDIVLQRPSVSREHLKVVFSQGQVTAYDLGSKNGASADDRPVPTDGLILRDGALIRLGDATLKYLDGKSPEADYHERSYLLATKDPLTGLNNRLSFKESLTRAIADWARRGGELAVAVLDLDHFKQVNDAHGHHAGDQVLRLTADVAIDQLRASDLVARLGGEEFVIALPDTGAQAMHQVLEQLGDKIRAQAKTLFAEPEITFSAGIACLPARANAALDLRRLQQRLLHLADQAMYQAKAEGRNRIVIADSQALMHQSQG